ncbi:10464_t:CDS:2 [Gigaspora margarita]|uniref:10464_t:CDS:1 n=1 Tax=Gigaspora margarita TaxID=4874 RepID=A0ABN7UMX5_GIGMA|nr:10464_t:CDS:2 [Gigaspora margarita]
MAQHRANLKQANITKKKKRSWDYYESTYNLTQDNESVYNLTQDNESVYESQDNDLIQDASSATSKNYEDDEVDLFYENEMVEYENIWD